MFATHPAMAKEWQAATPPGKLPERAQSKGTAMAGKESNFDKLAAKLAGKPGVSNPRGLAASIGAKKYGSQVMGQAAAQGRPAASIRRQNQSAGQGASGT